MEEDTPRRDNSSGGSTLVESIDSVSLDSAGVGTTETGSLSMI